MTRSPNFPDRLSDPLQQAADLIGDKLAAAMNVDKRMSPDEAVELGESA